MEKGTLRMEKDIKIYSQRSLQRHIILIEKIFIILSFITLFVSLIIDSIMMLMLMISFVAMILGALTFLIHHCMLNYWNAKFMQNGFSDQMFVFKKSNFLLIEGFFTRLYNIPYTKFSTVVLDAKRQIKLLSDNEDIVANISLEFFLEKEIYAILKEFEKHSKTIKTNGTIDLSNIKNNQEKKEAIGAVVVAHIILALLIILGVFIYKDYQKNDVSYKQTNDTICNNCSSKQKDSYCAGYIMTASQYINRQEIMAAAVTSFAKKKYGTVDFMDDNFFKKGINDSQSQCLSNKKDCDRNMEKCLKALGLYR